MWFLYWVVAIMATRGLLCLNWCKMGPWKLSYMVKSLYHWYRRRHLFSVVKLFSSNLFSKIWYWRTISWFSIDLAYEDEDCSWYSKVIFLNKFSIFLLHHVLCVLLLTCLWTLVRGLEYLHQHCYPAVIHRDMKSSNILLDSNFNAKVKTKNPIGSCYEIDFSLSILNCFSLKAFILGAGFSSLILALP